MIFPPSYRFRQIQSLFLILGMIAMADAFSIKLFAEEFHAGPVFDEFQLTLNPGHRTEILGPLFYDEHDEDQELTWAVPPLLSYHVNPAVENKEFDFLYPVLTYEAYGKEFRWQFFQLLSYAGGHDPQDFDKHRFTIFPLYFQQRSSNSNENYTAVGPFYGHLKNRLMRDRIFFVMFPVFSETQKRDIVTDNYLYPFFHIRHGDGLFGWQFWPLVGNEHKDITTQTNGFGDVITIGGHDKFFALWPIYFNQHTGIGTDNPQTFRGALPAFAYSRSPNRDYTSVIWPFFAWIDDREKKYHEWEGPWPFVVVARGTGKTTTRFWPLFGRSHDEFQESDFYLWPFYKFRRLQTEALDRKSTHVLFYLFENVNSLNKETGKKRERIDVLPLFTYHRDFDGKSRLQILALIEPVLPDSRGIERNWSPLWSLWRSEKNPQTGAHSQSLLWNLYRRDVTAESRKCSLLLGLFQYQSDEKVKKVRLFYIPIFVRHVHPTSS